MRLRLMGPSYLEARVIREAEVHDSEVQAAFLAGYRAHPSRSAREDQRSRTPLDQGTLEWHAARKHPFSYPKRAAFCLGYNWVPERSR